MKTCVMALAGLLLALTAPLATAQTDQRRGSDLSGADLSKVV